MDTRSDASSTLLRSLDLAPRAFAASSVGHGVRFIKHDHAVEIVTGPGEDLVEAGCIVSARTQRWIGHEKDSVAHRDGGAEFPGRQRPDIDREAAKRSPVAAGIFQERLVLRYPDMAAFPAHPSIKNDARDRTALPGTRSVPKKIAQSVSRLPRMP